MKRVFPLLILLAIVFASCQTKPKSAGEGVKVITIKYTELNRPTMFRIDCDRFDHYFPKPYTLNVVSKPAIDSLMAVLADLKRIDDESPDVRAKIYVTNKDNKIDTLCLGVATLRYKNSTYETPEKLLMMIQQ